MAPLRRYLFLCLLVAAGLLTSGPAAGDVLVTTDGSAVETRGEWEVKGKLVVFHTPAGTLSSLRLSDVDLDASRERTEAAKAAAAAPPAPPPPAPRRKATFVLTDADVGHVDPATLRQPAAVAPEAAADIATEDGSGGEATAPEPEQPVAPESSPMEVVGWDQTLRPDNEGVLVSGVVRNPTEFFATSIEVIGMAVSLDGEVVAERPARLRQTSLAPGGQTTFQVLFSDLFRIDDMRFEAQSFNALPRPPEAEDSDTENAEDE